VPPGLTALRDTAMADPLARLAAIRRGSAREWTRVGGMAATVAGLNIVRGLGEQLRNGPVLEPHTVANSLHACPPSS
jgi:hypothetical protein